ncbi:MAG: helix-turn-helix domain-containing protein [Lachnospiraceae bacterium]|nr:helix-turn-helix domain-containing protein [Lachnospiraceae bacterium]MBR3483046.1 helix-turn-helix domain-containing protein [Lachnospiraceae bacterium]MBR3579420.1 helix-turn-helix domain-containing protein [Lachnospiraceae bacterium]MBR4541346.1 helix-turn-helix domain-containing protein [Lachnospiraceae bacterium]
MAFTKANISKEKKELEQLIASSEDARKTYDDFQARINLQKELIAMRKAENLTQSDVAKATGLSQQAVSRIEKGTGATINSLIKYLSGIGYGIQFKKI